MQSCAQSSSTSDAELALLFCDSKQEGFYARFGWETLAHGRVLVAGHEPAASVMGLSIMDAFGALLESFETEPLLLDGSW